MQDEAPDTERRRFHRIPFQASVKLRQSGFEWPAELMDISFKGALVSRPKGWESAQTNALFRVEIEIDTETHIRFTAAVRHTEQDCLGLQCQNMDLDSASVLRRLVELNLGDSALLERELASLMEG